MYSRAYILKTFFVKQSLLKAFNQSSNNNNNKTELQFAASISEVPLSFEFRKTKNAQYNEEFGFVDKSNISKKIL